MPAAVRTAAQYAQVDALPVKRNSQRSIAHAPNVARMSIAKRVKKATLQRLRPKKAQRKRWEARELDEIWTFMGRKKRKGWMRRVVERASRRIVGRVLGSRGEAPLRRLWAALPQRYCRHCWYFTGRWKAYAKELPRW